MKVKHHSQLNSESRTSLVNSNWSLANPKHASRWKSLLPNMPNLSFRRLESVPTGVAHPACHEQRLLFFKSQCQHVDICLFTRTNMLQCNWAGKSKQNAFVSNTGDTRNQRCNLISYFSNKTQPLTNDRCTSIGVTLFVGKMHATDCTTNK